MCSYLVIPGQETLHGSTENLIQFIWIEHTYDEKYLVIVCVGLNGSRYLCSVVEAIHEQYQLWFKMIVSGSKCWIRVRLIRQ